MKTLKDYEYEWNLETKDWIYNTDLMVGIIYDSINERANDLNSSSFREEQTIRIAGYISSVGKLKEDAKTQDGLPVEIKPQNCIGNAKLNGHGNFSDLIWKRHYNFLENNLVMAVSGFVSGKTIFIVEFPYKNLQNRLEEQLNKKLPNGDVPNSYVRTASFTYKHWKDTPFKVKFIRENLEDYKPFIVKGLYELLMSYK